MNPNLGEQWGEVVRLIECGNETKLMALTTSATILCRTIVRSKKSGCVALTVDGESLMTGVRS